MRTQPVGLYLAMMLVLSLTSITACRKDKAVRIVDDVGLDALLAEAPQTVVDLDALQIEVWYTDRPVGTVRLPDTTLLLARPLGVISVSDSLYIADGGNNAIFVASLDGVLHRRVGREGQGPLEFEDMMQITQNDSLVFVKEGINRIQVLDNKLTYVDTISCPSVKGNIAATATYLLVPCGPEDGALVSVRSGYPPFSAVASLLPSLKDVPQSYNHYQAAASPTSPAIFVGYSGLPYLFVYDESLHHVQTLRFQGTAVEKLAQQTTRRNEGNTVLVQHFFQTLSFLGDRYLALAHYNTVYLIDIKDGRYQLVKTFRFDHAEPPRRKGDTGMHIQSMLLRDQYLYLATPFEEFVYRFPFQ